MNKNKIKYLLLTSYLLLLTFLVSCSPPANKTIGKPNIYHLRDNYLAHFYVYDNFQDNEICIKYLFDFAEKHNGYLIIMSHKDMYEFDDNIAFIADTISPQFAFVREREKNEEQSNNNTRNFKISVNYLKNIPLNFQIEESRNEEKISLKKLSADFDSLNVNIVQNFLDYSYNDYDTQKQSENYIYELYNKNNQLKIRQIYHDFGKWFDIKIF